MKRSRRFTCLIVCGSLILASPALADVVVDWNAIALQTVFSAVPPRPGPSLILDLAMVQAAVHDAIQAFEKRFEPYAVAIPNASGSPVAAAAVAAHDVLAARFPLQAGNLDTRLQTYLSGLGLLGNAGITIGHQAATAIITLRTGDGSFPPDPRGLPWGQLARRMASDAPSVRTDGDSLDGHCHSIHA